MSEIRQTFRWVVFYVDGDGSDEWQLVTRSIKKYFTTEGSARDFAKTHVFKKKPHYWQPSIWREEKFVYEIESWRVSEVEKLEDKSE